MRVTLGPLANVGEEAGSLHGHGGGGGLGKGGGGRRRGGREKGEVREVPPLVRGNGGAWGATRNTSTGSCNLE